MAAELNWQFYYNTKVTHSLNGFTQRGLGFLADVDYQLYDRPTKVIVGLSQHDTFGPFVGQVGHLWQTDSPSLDLLWGGVDYYTFNWFGDLTGEQRDKTYLFGEAVALDDQTALHLIKAARDLQHAHPPLFSPLEACISGILRSPRKK